MRTVYQNVAGLDVHKKVVVAAIIVLQTNGRWHQEKRTLGTMTVDLLQLSDWLLGHGVTHVAMESTGEYWKPIFNILENTFEIVLVNAQHLSRVPGRKTNQSDAEWIAELMQYGLLKASFIPPRAAGIARTDPLSDEFCPGTLELGQPSSKGSGKRQHQAG